MLRMFSSPAVRITSLFIGRADAFGQNVFSCLTGVLELMAAASSPPEGSPA